MLLLGILFYVNAHDYGVIIGVAVILVYEAIIFRDETINHIHRMPQKLFILIAFRPLVNLLPLRFAFLGGSSL